jgi:hypothetical protein
MAVKRPSPLEGGLKRMFLPSLHKKTVSISMRGALIKIPESYMILCNTLSYFPADTNASPLVSISKSFRGFILFEAFERKFE